MIRKNCLYKSMIFLFIVAAIISLASCTPQLKPSTDSANKDEENEPPKELEELRKGIEEIEKTLMSMYEDKKKAQEGIIASGSDSEGQDRQQGGQQSGQQGSQQQSQGEVKIELKPEELAEFTKQQQLVKDQEELAKKQKETLEKFEDLKKKVVELHEKWNAYEPKAVKALAKTKSIEEFEKNLDNLTNTIQSKDEFKTLLDVNSLLKALPDFYELYSTKVPPDLDRLKYSIKRVKLYAEKDDYNSMKPAIEYLTDLWFSAKPKLKKDITDQMNKFEFALNDLKNAVENKNKIVIDAKSEVLTKIIDEMVEKLKS